MKPGATAQPDASSSTRTLQVRADLADHPAGDRDVGVAAGHSAPVEDRAPADDELSRHQDPRAKPYRRAQFVAVILRRSASGSVPSDSSIACRELGNVLSVCG